MDENRQRVDNFHDKHDRYAIELLIRHCNINLSLFTELVVKLKDFSSAPPPKPKLKKKISIDEDSSGQAGYMASLIAKIIGNMSVICNNIVLKFIEEDIVLSMNVQHLSVHSADHRWRRSFIDVSPTNVLIRKLINIIDLTICLDKRNSSGKIEFVQEPLLYKCSMELRL
jgi:vacuolar protein sorting-associated protein 13B